MLPIHAGGSTSPVLVFPAFLFKGICIWILGITFPRRCESCLWKRVHLEVCYISLFASEFSHFLPENCWLSPLPSLLSGFCLAWLTCITFLFLLSTKLCFSLIKTCSFYSLGKKERAAFRQGTCLGASCDLSASTQKWAEGRHCIHISGRGRWDKDYSRKQMSIKIGWAVSLPVSLLSLSWAECWGKGAAKWPTGTLFQGPSLGLAQMSSGYWQTSFAATAIVGVIFGSSLLGVAYTPVLSTWSICCVQHIFCCRLYSCQCTCAVVCVTSCSHRFGLQNWCAIIDVPGSKNHLPGPLLSHCCLFFFSQSQALFIPWWPCEI